MSQTPNDPSPIDPVNNDAVNGQNPQGSVPNYTPPAAGATPPAGAYPPPSEGGFPPPPPVPGQQYGAPGQQYGAPGQQYGAPGQQYGAPGQPHPYPQTATQAPTVGEAFNWGWLKFTQNIGPIILGLIALIVPAVFGTILIMVGMSSFIESQTYYSSGGGGGGLFLVFLGGIISVLGYLLVQLGIYRAALDISQGRQVTFGTFFSFQDVGKVIVAAILLGLVTIVAGVLTFFLGGLGGVVFMFFAQFTLLFVLDKSLSPIDAIKASFSLVNKNLGTVVVLYIAVAIASFIGGLLLGLGLLVALPVSMLATAYMYRKLQGEPVAA